MPIVRLNLRNHQSSIYIEYMYAYKSKRSAYAKRKQTRRRAQVSRKRAGMRKKVYRKNTALVPSAEKKYFDHGFTNLPSAQYTGPLVGYLVENVTPIPSQGLGQNNRIGQKIFATGCILDCRITTQSSVTNAIKYKYYLVRIPDCYDYPATDIVPSMFDSNPFNSGVFDWHSNLDPETQGQFKVMAKGQGTILPDSIAGQTGIVQFRKYLKLGFASKWDSLTLLSQPVSSQWRLILFTDTGDNSANTGVTASMNFRTFYLDN